MLYDVKWKGYTDYWILVNFYCFKQLTTKTYSQGFGSVIYIETACGLFEFSLHLKIKKTCTGCTWSNIRQLYMCT